MPIHHKYVCVCVCVCVCVSVSVYVSVSVSVHVQDSESTTSGWTNHIQMCACTLQLYTIKTTSCLWFHHYWSQIPSQLTCKNNSKFSDTEYPVAVIKRVLDKHYLIYIWHIKRFLTSILVAFQEFNKWNKIYGEKSIPMIALWWI